MKFLNRELYQFIVIIVFFSNSIVANSTQYDDDKVTIYIEPITIINMSDPSGQKIIPNTIKFYKDLIKSNKFNIVLSDQANNQIIGGSGNFNPLDLFKEKVLTELEDNEKSHILSFNSLAQKDKDKISAKMISGDVFLPNGFGGDMKHSFADLVNKYKDNRTVPFAMKGTSHYLDHPTQELIFSLGAEAFGDDFSLNKIKYRLNHSKSPIICEARYRDIKVEVPYLNCIGLLVEVEIRWKNESLKKCGLFDKEQNKLITSKPAILCEPKHIQDFESYYESVIEDACQNIESCFSGISGKPLQDLTNSFLEIMVHTKRDEIRSKNREDENYNYERELDGLLKEIADFSLKCLLDRAGQYIESHLTENKDDINKARSLMEDSIRAGFGKYLTDDQLRETLTLADSRYKACLMINEKAGIASEGNEYYEQCLHESYTLITEDFIKEQAKKQGDSYADAKKHFIKSTETLCHISPPIAQPTELIGPGLNPSPLSSMLGGMGIGMGMGMGNGGGMAFQPGFVGFGMAQVEKKNLDSFSFSYDLPRCIDKVSKLSENYKALSPLHSMNLNALSESFSPPLAQSRLRVNLEAAIVNCLDELSPEELNEANQRGCFEQGKKEGMAQSLYDSLQFSSTEGFDSAIYRYKNGANDIMDLAKDNDQLKKCLEEKVSSDEMANCQKIVFEEMKAQGLSLVYGSGSADVALAEDLRLLTKELSREISVFHWAPDSLTGNNQNESIPLSSWNSYKYAVGREFMFHTGPTMDKLVPEAGATMAGRGLYAATDPNSSQSYGQTLFEIKLSEGSRFLDLREGGANVGGQIPITKDTFDKLQATGCDLEKIAKDPRNNYQFQFGVRPVNSPTQTSEQEAPEKPVGMVTILGSNRGGAFSYSGMSKAAPNSFYAVVSKSVFEKDRQCNNVFSKAISRLDVSFLAYNYGHDLPKFCDKESQTERPASAFVMIDTKMRGQVNSYNQAQIDQALKNHEEKGTPIPEAIKRIIQIYHENTNKAGTVGLNGPLSQDPETMVNLPSDAETINYWKSRIFNCDHSYEEDAVTSGLGEFKPHF